MKNIFSYALFVILLSFIFVINVNAECSYQERKELLNEAKAVDIGFEVYNKEKTIIGINPNTEKEEEYITTTYSFKMIISNMTNNMFAKITNDFDSSEIIVNYDDMKNNIYSFDIENTTDIITYYVDFYSTNGNCYANNITTKTVKKPKENPVYYYTVCTNDIVKDNNYCKHFIDKDFSKNEYDIVKELNDIVSKESSNKQTDDTSIFIDTIYFVSTYWYYFAIVLVLLVVGVTVLLIRKKRSTL